MNTLYQVTAINRLTRCREAVTPAYPLDTCMSIRNRMLANSSATRPYIYPIIKAYQPQLVFNNNKTPKKTIAYNRYYIGQSVETNDGKYGVIRALFGSTFILKGERKARTYNDIVRTLAPIGKQPKNNQKTTK